MCVFAGFKLPFIAALAILAVFLGIVVVSQSVGWLLGIFTGSGLSGTQ